MGASLSERLGINARQSTRRLRLQRSSLGESTHFFTPRISIFYLFCCTSPCSQGSKLDKDDT